MIKTLTSTRSNPKLKQVRLGRKRSPLGRHLRFADYLKTSVVPTPPASCDFSSKAKSALENIYGNDQLGDCVIAGGYHIVGAETGNAGDLFTATSDQIIADYSAIGGYVPGDPSTDQGCDLKTALNYWTSHGFANGTKLLNWMAVDPTNKTEVQQAMFLFENLYFGIELPDPWISPFPSASGFVWDSGTPDPSNGHCVMGVGYGPTGVLIDTWGMLGTLTWKAIAALCSSQAGGELYVMMTPDQLAKGQSKAPNGVLWSDLLADFQALGGSPTPPAPTPVPPSPPQPPTPPPAPAPTVLDLCSQLDMMLDDSVAADCVLSGALEAYMEFQNAAG